MLRRWATNMNCLSSQISFYLIFLWAEKNICHTVDWLQTKLHIDTNWDRLSTPASTASGPVTTGCDTLGSLRYLNYKQNRKGLAVSTSPKEIHKERVNHATRAPTQWRLASLASVWLECQPSALQYVSVSARFTYTRLHWRLMKFDACILQASLRHPTTRSFPRLARHPLRIHLLPCF